MSIVTTAIAFANEEAAAEAGHVNPYLIGGLAFVALVALLVATMMIKVGD